MQKSSRNSSFSDRGDFGAQSKNILSLTQGFVYVFGSVSVITNSKWSWSTRRKVSCRTIWSLCGEPYGSVQVLSVKPFESTTKVSPPKRPTEKPNYAAPG